MPGPKAAPDMEALFVLNPDDAWVITSNPGRIYRGGWEGWPSWYLQYRGSRSLRAINFATPEVGWVVGQEAVLRTTDGGRSWEQLHKGIFNWLQVEAPDTVFEKERRASAIVYWNSVGVSDEQTAWIAGQSLGSGLIIHTKDGGKTWVLQESGTRPPLNSVSVIDPAHVWAVGDHGTILFFDGMTWAAQRSGVSSRLRDVYFLDTNTGWVVGDDATILHTKNGGATWEVQNVALEPREKRLYDLRDVYFVDALNGWVAGTFGLGGVILHTNNGGVRWVEQRRTADDVNAIWFSDSQRGWAAGQFRSFWSTTDGGATWKSEWTVFYDEIPGTGKRLPVTEPGIGNIHLMWDQTQWEEPWPKIFLDGELVGLLKMQHLLMNVPEGQHTVKVVKEGYHEWSQEIEVRAGETVRVPVELTKSGE
jgi:photosystem II stability/assembly factor-like uncharacterized protein